MTSNQPWWLTWPLAEVAATILPLFSHFVRRADIGAMNVIVNWWKTGAVDRPFSPRANSRTPFEDPDFRAAAEAMHELERAGLLMRTFPADGGSDVGLTRLGMQALQANTVRQHLGLSDAPPTV